MVRQLANMLRKVFGTTPRQTRPAPQERPATQLALEGLEERLMPSLTPVAPNAGFPYTSIVEIQVTFPSGRSFVGSGALVDSYHVLTAGHVLYDYAEGGFASSVKVIPELNGTSEPFGYALGTREFTFQAWENYSRANPGKTNAGDQDMGLITLDRTIGKHTGWMGFGYNNNNAAFAPGTPFNTAGYPGTAGYNGRQMEFSAGGSAGLSSDGSAILYNQSTITAYGGQSGSPLWEYFANGTRVIYGVVAGGSGAANSVNIGTRITQAMYNVLLQDLRVDPTPGDKFSADPSGPNVYVSNTGNGNTTIYSFMSQPAVTSTLLSASSLAGQGTSLLASTNPLDAFTASARTLLALTGPAAGASLNQGLTAQGSGTAFLSTASQQQSADLSRSSFTVTDHQGSQQGNLPSAGSDMLDPFLSLTSLWVAKN